MSTSPKQTIAFFGATGDCAGFTLTHALNAGHDCTALARTPDKLLTSLRSKGVSSAALTQHLTIETGDVRDVEAVKRTLQLHGKTVSVIVSGIGSAPKLQASLFQPVTLADPTICEEATRSILTALDQLRPAAKPLLVDFLTTGISPAGKPRDVPLAFVLLYHVLLAVPHADKAKAQELVGANMQLPEARRTLRGFVHVKPSLLMDGEPLGVAAVRAGTDDAPAVGYTIRRADVGAFVYEKLLAEREVRQDWVNQGVCITY